MWFYSLRICILTSILRITIYTNNYNSVWINKAYYFILHIDQSSHHNSPHQHHGHPVSSQHHSPSLSSFLKLSSSKASKSVDLTSGRLPKSSPLPKYKSKFAQKIEHKAEGSADATLTTPQTHGRDRSPSFGTIPQIVAPTPPGGLPVFVTPVASFEESTSGLTPEAYKRLDKRAKYAKSRAKSSGAMKWSDYNLFEHTITIFFVSCNIHRSECWP